MKRYSFLLIAFFLPLARVEHLRAGDHVDNFQVLQQFCSDCHAPDVSEGGFDLSALQDKRGLLINRRVTQRVIAQLESGTMPPDDPRPSAGQIVTITNWLRSTLANADWEELREPVELLPARLTRQEYANSIRDLLGVNVDFSDLLPEDSVGANGFNNDRASMAMTESNLQQCFEAAQRAAGALLDWSRQPAMFHVEAEDARHVTIHNVKNVSTLSDGTAGFEYHHHRGIKYQQVSRTIDFPRTGMYRARIRAKVTGKGKQGGIWIAVDSIGDQQGRNVLLIDKPEFDIYTADVFVTAGHHEVIIGSDFNTVPWLPPVPNRPQRKLPSNRDAVVDEFYDRLGIEPVSWKEIESLPGFREPEDKGTAMDIVEELNRVLLDESVRIFELFRLYEAHQFLPVNQPKGLRNWATEGEAQLAKIIGVDPTALHDLWTSHEPPEHRMNEENSQALVDRWKALNADRQQHVGNVFLDWFEVSGPNANNAVRASELLESLKVDEPSLSVSDGTSCMRRALKQLLPVAFRRSAIEEYAVPFVELYANERNAGASHRVASERTLIAVMMSPYLIYVGADNSPSLGEGRTRETSGRGGATGSAVATNDPTALPSLTLDPPGVKVKDDETAIEEVQLTTHQLAARLSYLFWMATPDDALIRAVDELDRADNLAFDNLIDAMLADERSMSFFRDFTSQWLGLGSLGREKTPDSELFREFSWQLAEDMREQVALMFREAMLNDRNILDLLDGDITFLNERLARLYGNDAVRGIEFQTHSIESTLPQLSERKGLLGTAAVLTATSLPARTSPVQRGQFVVETLLGEDLPPPPEDAGALPENAGQSDSTTLREQLAAHRDNPSCIGCHERIDPIGFALEKFDFVGRYRQQSPAGPIDDVGVLPDQRRVAGLSELNAYLRESRGDAFVDTLARRLMAYSLGRGLDYRDEADVQLIVQSVHRDGNSLGTLVHEIIRSRAFQMRQR